MSLIPEKVSRLKPYGFENSEGVKIKADANESFISLPQRLREKIADIALNESYNRYPDPLASDAVSAYARYIGVPSGNITPGNGSDELLSIIISSLLNRGDRLCVAEPDFAMYRFYAGLAEVDCVSAKKDADYKLDVPAFKSEIEQKNPAAVIFSNPCSPTGQALPREAILKLVSDRRRLWVIDEAYMEFAEGSIADEAVKADNVIVLRTCSKAFGLAAIRLGFAIAGEKLTEALRKVKSPANINSLTNHIAAAVISDSDYIASASAELCARSAELNALLTAAAEGSAIRALPSCGNFTLLAAKSEAEARSLRDAFRQDGILVRCLGSCLRVTACSSDENKLIAEVLTKWLNEKQS